MRKTAILLGLLLLAAPGLAFAQGGAPSASGISHFSVSASAIPWASGQAAPGTIEGGSVSLTNSFSLGFQRIDLSPIVYDIGVVEYTKPLLTFVPKKVQSSLTFNAVPWSVTFFGGGGLSSQFIQAATYSYTDHEPAFTLGMGLNYTANGHVAIQIVSGQWLHTSTPTGAINNFLVSPNTASISSTLKLTL